MDYTVNTAEPALQVVNVPTPAAADSMHIIIRCSDNDSSLRMLQQVLQPLEGSHRVSGNREWFDAMIKCRVVPAADAGMGPGTRREGLTHN